MIADEPRPDTRPRTDTLPLAGKLGLLAALYIAQGLPFGFFTQTVSAIMRKQGYRLSEISYSALLTLPWALKFAWAPLVDRFPAPTATVRARRVRWILACQAAQVAAFGALASYGRLDHLPPLFVGFFVLNLVSATQDIATDGFAVDMLRGRERGYANGVQVAGYRGGMVVGGGLLLIILDRIGARAGFFSLATLTLLLSVPLLLVREAPPLLAAKPLTEAPRLPHFLRVPGVGRVLLVVTTYKLAESLASGVLRPFLIDRGLSLAQLGAINGVAGSTGGLLGALSGGALASWLGRRRAIAIAGVIQTAAIFLFAFAAAHADERACARDDLFRTGDLVEPRDRSLVHRDDGLVPPDRQRDRLHRASERGRHRHWSRHARERPHGRSARLHQALHCRGRGGRDRHLARDRDLSAAP